MSETRSGLPLQCQTENGLIEGFEEDGVRKFFGIPFAAPPTGDLRWRPPAPALDWEGIRSAKEFSAAPYQTIAIPRSLRANGVSEDCLYLNIWSPANPPEPNTPVMFWFFGGGNLRGAASVDFYDGSELAKMGVTVVSPNYRVGCFGFLNDEKIGANFAVQDQIAALIWVRDNIAAFGGDPTRVTIFGNSAGAVAVRSLIESPKARGLFHRAYMQSAGGEDPANGIGWSFARSRAATEALWQTLGTNDPIKLRQMSAEKVGTAAHPLSGIFASEGHIHTPLNLVWMPVADNDVVGDEQAGWPEDVPLLIGCTENEGRWTLSPTEAYSRELLENMCRQLAGSQAEEVLTILDKAGGTVFEKLDRIYTTAVWLEPAYASLKRFAAQGRKVYYSLFTRSGPEAVVTGRLASHGAPVPYIFGNLEDDGSYDEVDQRISRELRHALVEFAKTGVPTSTGGNEWPAFDLTAPKQTVIGDTIGAAMYKINPLLRAVHALRDFPKTRCE